MLNPLRMDADAPVTIFKKSKSRTPRAHSATPTDNAPDGVETSVAPSALAAKLRKQHKERNKPRARLSFGGDDEVSFIDKYKDCAADTRVRKEMVRSSR